MTDRDPAAQTVSRKAAREPIRNEFSWSRSRAQVLAECPRQYFFTYYGSWGGWERGADPRVRRTYVLKQLKTRQMWAGEIVHQIIERALGDLQRGIARPRVDEIIATAHARMRRDFKSSRERAYHRRPKTLALYEHEYALPVSDRDWKDNAEHVALCIRNFFGSDTYERVKNFSPGDFLEIEHLSTFSVAGVRVWVKLDAALKAGPAIVIIDWKTGRSDREDTEQLACYALYCAQRYGVEPQNLQLLVYNLALGEGQTYTLGDEAVRRMRAEIIASIETMRGYLRDPAANEALDEEAFALATDERPCRRCNYRAVCPRFAST